MEDNRFEYILNLESMIRFFFRQFSNELNRLLGNSLTGTEFSILSHLSTKSPQIVTELSQEFQVSVSHITHVTDQLVRKQLAQRKRSQLDKRVVEIHITEKGKNLVEMISQKKKEYVNQKFSPLTTDEIKLLVRLFHQINHTQ